MRNVLETTFFCIKYRVIIYQIKGHEIKRIIDIFIFSLTSPFGGGGASPPQKKNSTFSKGRYKKFHGQKRTLLVSNSSSVGINMHHGGKGGVIKSWVRI